MNGTALKGLGFKDHSQEQNALDLMKDKTINIQTESVKGIYMPDGIATYEKRMAKNILSQQMKVILVIGMAI